jgi:hypothetical protein
MNLYRLDREARDGTDLGPVSDMLGPCLIRRWTAARTLAVETARGQDCYVIVSRINGGGNVRRMGIATPALGYSPTTSPRRV